MIVAAWDWLWDKHDQVKDMFHFFVKPNSSKMGTDRGKANEAEQTSGNGGNNRSYKPAQWIGLIAGPALFLITLLFVSPE
jgi:sodium-dependent dicarboxylate transporter 2/3/5